MKSKETRIIRSEYFISAVSSKNYPKEKLPEFVFVGRSNVGKSSLINSLTNRKNLAHISSVPGKTQTINFFRAAIKFFVNDSGLIQDVFLVDLPGYGYAKTSKVNRDTWKKFIDDYLKNSRNIKFVCQLIDMRHQPMESDLNFFDSLVKKKLPTLVVATKSDKLNKNDLKKNFKSIKNSFGISEESILIYSSVNNIGRAELLKTIVNSLIKH